MLTQRTTHRTGLLIIRAWVEPGSTRPLRAQIRITEDVSAGMERTVTLAQPSAVGAVVDGWLEAMLGGGTKP